VLVADDEPGIRRFVSTALRTAGFEVDVVSTASDALQALTMAHYEVFIADIKMPGNEQLELLEGLGDEQSVPLLLMTAEPSLDTALAALRGGVLDYLVKPFSPEALLARVNAAIEKARQARADAERQAKIAALLEAAVNVAQVVGNNGRASVQAAPTSGSSADGAATELDQDLLARLSPRQREVVRLLALGHPLPEIAEELKLSAHTVRAHMKAIFTKLGVRSQVALISRVAGRDPK
jgi:DNA-binding NarL/FixJ family response regulator